MATDPEINAVIDLILAVFDSNPVLFESFLQRARLETELAQIESRMRIERAEQAADQTAHETELQALEALRLQKQAEIDAL